MNKQSALEYNSQRGTMIIPEYGRNVEKMIAFACTIDDKEERNKCANAIISVMGQLNPHLRDIDDYKHKLWAHLFVMSDFKLDVDSPYPIPSAESLATKPDLVKYPQQAVRFGHYGKSVEDLINKAIEYDDGDEKDYLVGLIGNLMKRSYIQWNNDSVQNSTIVNDIDRLSGGKLTLKEPESTLLSTTEIIKLVGKKKQEFTHKKHNSNNRHKNNNNKNKNYKKKY